MAKITNEITNLSFSCARCQVECEKINSAEAELGYVSKVDGQFVGPLCTKCFEEIPKDERVIKKVAETAFLIIIKSDGEGAVVTAEGIETPYLREPTSNDVVYGCNKVVKDIEDSLFAQKLTSQLMMVLANAQKKSKLVMAR